MKNKFLITLITTLALAGCSNKTPSNLDVSVLCPTGAPSLAFYNYALDTSFETNSNASTGILPQMIQGNKDVIVLPTNAGVQAIVNKSAPYKLAATITFGNIFIASTGNDDNNTLDDGDYIVLFQKGQVPDLLFHYIYGTTLDSNAHYVADASEASKCLKTGKNLTSNNEIVDYVLIAEPALTSVMASTLSVTVTKNLQEEYKTKTNGLEIYQASIFINNNLDKQKADNFLSMIEKDINNGLNDFNKIKEGLEKAESIPTLYGVNNAEIVLQTLQNNNSMGLGFKKAKPNKQAIDNFLSLFNIGETNEEIYY